MANLLMELTALWLQYKIDENNNITISFGDHDKVIFYDIDSKTPNFKILTLQTLKLRYSRFIEKYDFEAFIELVGYKNIKEEIYGLMNSVGVMKKVS